MEFKNIIFKVNLKYSFCLILLSITVLFWLQFNFTRKFSPQIILRNSVPLRKVTKQAKKLNCDLFFKANSQQYQVELDDYVYPRHVFLYQNKSINFDCLNENSKTKIILIQTPIREPEFFSFKTGLITPFKAANCPAYNCELTNDTNKSNQSHLVLFEMGIHTHKYIPSYRLLNQSYVFVHYESPINSPSFSWYKNFFNMTSTYEFDSDFPGFYSSWNFRWALNDSFNETHDFSANKLKFSTAIISNCNDNAHRLEYLQELKKYINVDIFGKCGKKCPEYYTNTNVKSDCKQILAREYKFILAFENSVCKDYITEKFFDVLAYDCIPVVRGGGKYDEYVPRSGFIDAFDFRSAKHLAEYLIYLDNNKTAYNLHFKWKKHVQFYRYLPNNSGYVYSPLCDMCINLHLKDLSGNDKSQIIKNPQKNFYCKSYAPLFINYIYAILILIAIVINSLIALYITNKQTN